MTWIAPLALALVLAGDASMLLSEGQYRAALPAAEQALEQAEQRGDEPAIARASLDLSVALIRMGHPDESHRHARRADDARADLHDRRVHAARSGGGPLLADGVERAGLRIVDSALLYRCAAGERDRGG